MFDCLSFSTPWLRKLKGLGPRQLGLLGAGRALDGSRLVRSKGRGSARHSLLVRGGTLHRLEALSVARVALCQLPLLLGHLGQLSLLCRHCLGPSLAASIVASPLRSLGNRHAAIALLLLRLLLLSRGRTILRRRSRSISPNLRRRSRSRLDSSHDSRGSGSGARDGARGGGSSHWCRTRVGLRRGLGSRSGNGGGAGSDARAGRCRLLHEAGKRPGGANGHSGLGPSKGNGGSSRGTSSRSARGAGGSRGHRSRATHHARRQLRAGRGRLLKGQLASQRHRVKLATLLVEQLPRQGHQRSPRALEAHSRRRRSALGNWLAQVSANKKKKKRPKFEILTVYKASGHGRVLSSIRAAARMTRLDGTLRPILNTTVSVFFFQKKSAGRSLPLGRSSARQQESAGRHIREQRCEAHERPFFCKKQQTELSRAGGLCERGRVRHNNHSLCFQI